MRSLNIKLNIDFMKQRKPALMFSVALIIIAIGSLAVRGLNFGVDFTGGYIIEVSYDRTAELNDVRDILADAGVAGATVQHIGTSRDVLIRLAPSASDMIGGESGQKAAQVSDNILTILKKQNPQVQMRRVEYVGSQVGEELKNDGGLAVLIALMCTMIYIMIRFEWKFAVGAVVSLAHNVIISLGVFAVLQADFDLTTLAAVLAVVGYSLNDTIVIFDRIRENFRKIRNELPVAVVNISINQTLSRTIITSGTTLMVMFALFFLGGDTIHSFSLMLIVGIIVGVFSSVYVASSLTLALGLSREDLMVVKKEAEIDHQP